MPNSFLILLGCSSLPLMWREGRRGFCLPKMEAVAPRQIRRISRSGHSAFSESAFYLRKLFLDARSSRHVLRHRFSSSASKHHKPSQYHVEVFAGVTNSIAPSSCHVSIYLQIALLSLLALLRSNMHLAHFLFGQEITKSLRF